VEASFPSAPFADTMRRRRVRRGLLALALVLSVGGAAAALLLPRGREAAPARAPAAAAPSATETNLVSMPEIAQRNIALATVPAVVAPIVRSVRATGMVGFDETRVVRMRPLARGRLLQTRVELGSRVRKGDVLATYDNVETGDVSGERAVAQAGLAEARVEAETAARALERARELLAIGGTARADVERRTADAARAQARVQTRQAEIAKLDEKLRRFGVAPTGREATPILAPIDGIVVKIGVVPGEMVDIDREAFTIADLSSVWVQADVLETDLALIRPGQAAAIGVAAYPDRRFAGTVAYVAEMLDPKTNTARVRCRVDNADGALKLNMFAGIEIAVPTGHDGVTVPPAALQDVDGQPVVFVRTGAERFERRNVGVGVEARGWVELTDGVAAGEPVVANGSFALKSILLRDRIAGD